MAASFVSLPDHIFSILILLSSDVALNDRTKGRCREDLYLPKCLDVAGGEHAAMRETDSRADSRLQNSISRDGYIFVQAKAMHEALVGFGSLSDWQDFVLSWNDLQLDTFMADGGRYRRRRHAVYAATTNGTIRRKPHEAHYQSRDYNPLNGGIARWFAPVTPEVGSGPSMLTILGFCRRLFCDLGPDTHDWRIEVHQFRIEAKSDEEGQPTPEGMHRDGVDFVLVLLINRRNIALGTTTIHDLTGHRLGSFTLTEQFDAALLDDTRCYHGVTPVKPIDPALPAYRDVLVVTLRKTVV